ncbi:hypothetical protein [Zhongshania sp.]|uniref:hypothetical protein n=1 Tax=Zhongshania sp. TaxID=1971902 RepID=UPI002A83FA8C|nr:hypothetical protein [Zhongshania sp.]
MEIVPVEQKLKCEGLESPRLNALQADDTLYTVLAHQPPGRIRIAPDSIGNADSAEAKQRTVAFLQLAATAESQPDVVVSPEYSVPWEALLNSIEQGVVPEEGKLWVLGCESLPIRGLDAIRQRLGELAVVLDDDVYPGALTTQKYRNPLVYVFATKCSADRSERLVLLVQYKTEPSGDPENTEATGMLPGICIYAFGTLPSEVRLITLVCSDVFGFRRELIDQYYKGLFLLHVQLNNSPRHLLYKKYRQELFAAAGETELLCLNWAENVISIDQYGANEQRWGNICGSAWYLSSPETDLSDDAILENHRHGIYYTRHEPIRTHALQFHYRPRVFFLQSTKVFHHAIPKPRSMRTGPKALKTFVWAQDQNKWVEPRTPGESPADGFCEQLEKCSDDGIPLDDLRDLYLTGPIAVERTMAITAGQFGVIVDWHAPARIDSMRLCEQEVVRRVTITQDPAPEAVKFRDDRFALTRAIAELRVGGYHWPSSVEALRKGFKFCWYAERPNRNVVADDGTLATIVHAGLVSDHTALDRLDQKVRKTLAGPPPEPERVLSQDQEKQFLDQHYATGAQRFCIVYMTATGTKTYLSGRGTSFTTLDSQSAVDIGVPSFTRFAENTLGEQ